MKKHSQFTKFKAVLGLNEFLDFVKKDWEQYYIFILTFLTLIISINYYFDLEDSYLDLHANTLKGVLLFFLQNLCIYLLPLFLMFKNPAIFKAIKNYRFWTVLLLALLCLSVYQSLNLYNLFFPEWYSKNYYNQKVGARFNSLSKYLFILVFLGIIIGRSKEKMFGFLNFDIKYKTYLGFLLVMLPLIIFASTQQDFLDTYPKLKQINVNLGEYINQLLLYEPLYLADFIMLEWFFRGFMVLFFARYISQKSVILVALVYCSFHFGKPILECISSFFGGYLLGYIVYKSKSIWGGVIVHMGIAFLVDVFAFYSVF